MFENTKLSPVFNGYQYLFVCLVAIVLDVIVHFFSIRKYQRIQNKVDVLGFAPWIGPHYKSLAKYGPLSMEGSYETMSASINSYLVGAVIAGSVSLIVLLIADLILYGMENR